MSKSRLYLLAQTVKPRALRYEFRQPRNRKKSLRDHRTATR